MQVADTSENRPIVLSAQACARCWKRKQKCDRVIPSCSACQQLGVPCQSRGVDQKRGGDHDVGFVTGLQRRLQQLKSDVRHSEPDTQVAIAQARINSSEGLISHGSEPETPPNVFTSSENATVDSLGALSLHTMSEGISKGGDLRNRSIYVMILRAALHADLQPSSQISPSGRGETNMSGDDTIKYQHDLQQWLEFSKSICLGYPNRLLQMLCPIPEAAISQHLVRDISEALANDGLLDIVAKRPEDLSMLYLIAAITFHFHSQQDLTNFDPQRLSSEAKSWLQATVSKATSFKIAQCLVMLTILSTIDPAYGSTWYLLGLAINECLSLGLHNRDLRPPTPDYMYAEADSLLWTVFVLDCVSLALGRPSALSATDINLPMPESISNTVHLGTTSGEPDLLLRESVDHAFLLDGFRHDEIRSFLFHAINYRTWSDEHPLETLDTAFIMDPADLWAYKNRCRLRCRAWIELAVILSKDETTEETTEETTVDLRPLEEITLYLRTVRAVSETQKLRVTTIEALDALAGVVSYTLFTTYCFRIKSVREQSPSQAIRGIREAGIIAADVLTAISQRFTVMLALREAIRAFTAIIEDNSQASSMRQGFRPGACDELQSAVSACGSLLSRDVEALMWRCVNQARLLYGSQGAKTDVGWSQA